MFSMYTAAGSFEDLVLSMDLRLTQAAIVDQYVFAVNQHRLQVRRPLSADTYSLKEYF